MLEKRYSEALDEWQSAIHLSPSSSDLHDFEGLALDALGRHDEARVAYRTAIRLRPGNLEARSNLAYNLASAGSTREAQQEFDRALNLRPADAPLHLGRGLLQFELGDALAACSDFQKSKPWPEDVDTIWTIFRACVNARKMEVALAAARLLPREAATQLEIGIALGHSLHVAESREFLEPIAKSSALANQAKLAIAEGYITSGDPEKAVFLLRDIPADSAVLELRSTALIKLNRREEAQVVLNELLQRYPESPLSLRRRDAALA